MATEFHPVAGISRLNAAFGIGIPVLVIWRPKCFKCCLFRPDRLD